MLQPLIPLEADFDEWGSVLVAVELRIRDLEKVEASQRTSSFCQEQLVGLKNFSFNMRKKFQYAMQLNAEDRSHN
jgi:hypothetical protein